MEFSKQESNHNSVILSDFKNIIEEINESDNFLDKELIFSIYFNLFNSFILPLCIFDDSIISRYRYLINETIIRVIKLSRRRKDMVSAYSFISNLLYYLRMKEEFSGPSIKSVIDLYSDNLDMIINEEKLIINSINSSNKELDFNDRCYIIMCYKEFISGLDSRIVGFYDIDYSFNLREYMRNSLCSSLGDTINDSNDLLSFNSTLKKNSINNLNYIVKNDCFFDDNCFNFFNFKNEMLVDTVSDFNDLERDVFRIYILFKIAGYNNNDLTNDMIDVNDIAECLNIEFEICNDSLKKCMKKLNKCKRGNIFGLIRKKKRKKDI